jgi:eukaryotic-like serine/threonine-protein kinase
MSPERWHHISEIAADCLAIEDAELREQHLVKACAEDAALALAVRDVLQQDAAQGNPLHRTAMLHAAAQSMGAQTALAGARLGPWQLDAEIARGGMGTVYRAHRADGEYAQDVAIKLVRADVNSQQVVDRFHAERQILASLAHPNIARLIDGGTRAEGTPYLVMEYVDGESIIAYATRHQLDIAARLQLFRTVCAAVHFAHQRLVVHRDLKPSNIFVTHAGEVKLLDFGIAKVLESTPAVDGPAQTTMLAMTPAYASPEQVKGETVTTASDVYALGVVLYELLTGQSPYKSKTTQPLALAKEIVDTEPERPSQVAERADDNTPALKKLRTGLRAELDNIVLMALRKEPARRYSSAEQLASDITRYLGGLPVLAHTDSWRYRTHKFVVRNRWAVGFATLAIFGLVAGIATTIYQASEAQIAKNRAEKLFKNARAFTNKIQVEGLSIISDIPGSNEAQKFVLDASLAYQKELALDAGSDRQLLLEIAAGFVNLGMTQERALVAVQTRRETLLTAQGLVDRAEQLLPRDTASLRVLIRIKTRLAVLDVEQQKYPSAKTLFEEAIILAKIETGREAAFTLVDARSEAYVEYGRAAGVEESVDRRIAMVVEAKALIEALDRTKLTESEKYDADLKLATILGYLAFAENERQGPAAIDASMAYSVRGIALLEERYRQTPNNLRVLGNLSHFSGQLADAHGKKNDFVSARIYFKKARDYAEPLIRRDPTQSMLTINMLSGQLSEMEMELRAKTEPTVLIATLIDVDRQVKALPANVRQERSGIALKCWVDGLLAEAKFRRGMQADIPLDARRTLLHEAMALFAESAAIVETIPEMVDQNTLDTVELVRSGEKRARAALDAIRGK